MSAFYGGKIEFLSNSRYWSRAGNQAQVTVPQLQGGDGAEAWLAEISAARQTDGF